MGWRRQLGRALVVIGAVWTILGGTLLVGMIAVGLAQGGLNGLSGDAGAELFGGLLMLLMLASPGAAVLGLGVYIVRTAPITSEDTSAQDPRSVQSHCPSTAERVRAAGEPIVMGVAGAVVFSVAGWTVLVRVPPPYAGILAAVLAAAGAIVGLSVARRRSWRGRQESQDAEDGGQGRR